jgi:hypothetical protein
MNSANTKLSVLIHPSFVRKSYRYLGIPPRTNINNAISSTNFIAINTENREVTLKIDKQFVNGFSTLK